MNQRTEFRQTLVDDVTDSTYELVRFWRSSVKVKVTARSNIWASYCRGRKDPTSVDVSSSLTSFLRWLSVWFCDVDKAGSPPLSLSVTCWTHTSIFRIVYRGRTVCVVLVLLELSRDCAASPKAQRNLRLNARDPHGYLVSGNRYNWLQLSSTSDWYRFTPETPWPTIPILSIRSEPFRDFLYGVYGATALATQRLMDRSH